MTDIIDIHTHVISPDTARYPLAPLGGKQSDWSHARPTTAADLIAAMDEAGVAKAAVVQASTAYGFDNSYLADSVAAHPNRFTGVFSMDLFAPDAPAVFDRWVAKGLTGLRLFTTGTTQPGQAGWLADPRSFPIWERAEAANLPVCVQMRPEGVDQLALLLDRFRRVPVVLDHLARVDLSDGAPYEKADWLWRLADRPNVVLKLTSRTVREAAAGASRPEAFFPRLVAAFGAERIAWGSNFPAEAGPMSRILDAARAALSCLSAADRASIFAGTARRLYPALAAEPVTA
ncbi:amidohydrolase family protein [Rhodoplanes sp. TEM]|uniref:Amidohydrolase family protein n=1 Tax=Rhodoplanes tepidamans TaxID=200616 RepID=A0ABT5JFR6_RHOTP|nr:MULTISPECIES: amidohydrolase family protein [Rhodoplanes]MDC7788550.1 amidohydrolase family protein [Rhodoplanes tepidamans]MDC7985149.1 amidohydrolase family protein [Rhodoplanes sp. TEM]MDQ0353391.1 putative TIM-barrel fold metal-dependent hydrolase [Rhodoplanes tepidamans]